MSAACGMCTFAILPSRLRGAVICCLPLPAWQSNQHQSTLLSLGPAKRDLATFVAKDYQKANGGGVCNACIVLVLGIWLASLHFEVLL